MPWIIPFERQKLQKSWKLYSQITAKGSKNTTLKLEIETRNIKSEEINLLLNPKRGGSDVGDSPVIEHIRVCSQTKTQ